MNGEDATNGEGGASHPQSAGGGEHGPAPLRPADAVAAPSPTAPNPPAAPGNPLGVGDVISGIYRITGVMALEHTGDLYEGVNIHLAGERVAIKVLRPRLGAEEPEIASLANSVSRLTQLRHEAIVDYRLVARDTQGRPFIVAEYVDGPSLESWLNNMRLTDEQFGDLAIRLAAGLGAAHALGVLHLNVAPDNVLLAAGDRLRPKIVSFDLSMLPVAEGNAGNLKYSAPEQFGEYGGRVGPWTDVYGLALTLLAIASGRHPDMGDSIADAVGKRMSVPGLSAIPAHYRPAFERALQPNPERRPQSIAAFAALLSEAKERVTGSSPKVERGPDGLATVAHERGGRGDRPSEKSPRASASAKWTIVGGVTACVVALAACVTFLVKLGDGEGSDSPANLAGAETFAAVAARIAEEPACSWISFDGSDGSVLRFVGAAGNPERATSALTEGIAAMGSVDALLETEDIVAFDESMCEAIDALRAFRSSERLITLPQRTFEAEDRDMILSGGISLGPGGWTRPNIRVRGVRPEENFMLVVIEADAGMQPLFNGRDSGKDMLNLLSGTALADGFEVPYPVKLERPPAESFGLAIIVGKGTFPVELFGDPSLEKPGVPLDVSWPDRFRTQARVRGWRTDIVWFSVADTISG
jgi:eukaryotic-like serine/threonine-protein kinase